MLRAMRDIMEAHYLHRRAGLEPLIRPRVGRPTAMAWVPRREELLVATRDGKLHQVDPVMGTRVVAESLGEVAQMVAHADRERILLVNRTEGWRIIDRSGTLVVRGSHGFLAGFSAAFVGERIVLIGDDLDGRRLMMIEDGQVRLNTRVPARLIAANGKDAVLLVRGTERGLAVTPLVPGVRLPGGKSTRHQMSLTDDQVLGLTGSGLCVWGLDGKIRLTMRTQEVTTGILRRKGRYLALGTRNGAVQFADLQDAAQRANPSTQSAHESAVTQVAFSERGRWLASAGGDTLQLWTWEDPDDA